MSKPCNGGNLLTLSVRGFFGQGDMQKEFEDAAFKLEPGQISGIVSTASGLHLIQRSDPTTYSTCSQTLTRVGFTGWSRGLGTRGSELFTRRLAYDRRLTIAQNLREAVLLGKEMFHQCSTNDIKMKYDGE